MATSPVMDESTFQNEKRRILANPDQWKVFQRMRTKIDMDTKRPGHQSQCPFSFAEADKACAEWGWPNTEANQDYVLKVVMVRLLGPRHLLTLSVRPIVAKLDNLHIFLLKSYLFDSFI